MDVCRYEPYSGDFRPECSLKKRVEKKRKEKKNTHTGWSTAENQESLGGKAG